MKRTQIVISIVIVIVIVLLVFLPRKLLPLITNPVEFENTKSIYTIMSSITSVLMGFSGILIGYFYYKDKIKNDKEQNEQKKLSSNLQKLSDEIKVINENLIELFDKNIMGKKELDKRRQIINNSFDIINILLETNEAVFNFKDEELKKIIAQYCMIEKNEALMRYSFAMYRKCALLQYKEKYCSIYRSILSILFRKI